MICRVADRVLVGGVLDCRDAGESAEGVGGADGTGGNVAAAIRGESSSCDVVCAAPGPVHERVGHVRPEMGCRPKTALAAAGRQRGIPVPQAGALADARHELARLERTLSREGDASTRAGSPERADGGEPATGAGGTAGVDGGPDRVERLRERVAALRGRIREREAADRDAAELREELREAAAALSEATTGRVAATQRRERARERRERRERRLALEDRVANLEREARAHRVAALEDEYATAVSALGHDDDPFAAPAPTAALAILRVAPVRAPVVLAVDRFDSPAAAASWLDAPVIRV